MRAPTAAGRASCYVPERMQLARSSLLVAAVVVGAGVFALVRDAPEPEAPVVDDPVVSTEPLDDVVDPSGEGEELSSDEIPPDDEPPALVWSVPSAWPVAPNPSPIRIGTYRVPRSASDAAAADAELSILRAGGETDANIERWAEQFKEGSAPERAEKTVHGVVVTTVFMEGTYSGGMGADDTPHEGWAMVAAIVATPGLPYFFKLVGPRATVRGARGSFDAMLDGVRPAPP